MPIERKSRGHGKRFALWLGIVALSITFAAILCQYMGHDLLTLTRMPFKQLAIGAIVLCMIGMLVYMQFDDDLPDVWDLLREDGDDCEPRRLSMSKTITVACCMVGLWYAIAIASDSTFDVKDRAGSFLLQLILIFVVYRGTNQVSDKISSAIKNKPPALPAAAPNVGQQVLNLPDAEVALTPSPAKLPSMVRGITP